jgi:F-type H+-transporting ATPase subunit epsilon
MTTFTMVLRDVARRERIEGVRAFVGQDASGSFGILARRARFMTVLVFGLARFQVGDAPWRYLAVPGAVLYFDDGELSLTTRHYLVDDDYERISQLLRAELVAEEQELHEMKESLHRMEEEILRRLWRLGRGEEGRG